MNRGDRLKMVRVALGYAFPALIGLVCIGWAKSHSLAEGIQFVFAPENWGRTFFWFVIIVAGQFFGLRVAARAREPQDERETSK